MQTTNLFVVRCNRRCRLDACDRRGGRRQRTVLIGLEVMADEGCWSEEGVVEGSVYEGWNVGWMEAETKETCFLGQKQFVDFRRGWPISVWWRPRIDVFMSVHFRKTNTLQTFMSARGLRLIDRRDHADLQRKNKHPLSVQLSTPHVLILLGFTTFGPMLGHFFGLCCFRP